MFVRVWVRICDRGYLPKGKKASFWRFKGTIINFYSVPKYFCLGLLSTGHLEIFDFDTEIRAICHFYHYSLKFTHTLQSVGDICITATKAKFFKLKMKQSEISRTYECHFKSFVPYFKRPLSSFENPRFENEAPDLILTEGSGGTRKWSINILRNSPWVKILATILLFLMFIEDTINLFLHLFNK